MYLDSDSYPHNVEAAVQLQETHSDETTTPKATTLPLKWEEPAHLPFNAFPRDAHSAAKVYLSKGLSPIPVKPKSKKPTMLDWPELRVSDQNLHELFPANSSLNIGIMNGYRSGNHIDVDLDCDEARLSAGSLLPHTGWVFGRKSEPRSHFIYKVDEPLDVAQIKYTDVDGEVLCELRGTGGYTVFPPSVHEETGEQITWDSFSAAGVVALNDLQRVVREIAAIALLARHWPEKGSRQDAYLAMVGGLLRAGYSEAQVERLVEALATVTNDEEARKRVQIVNQTANKQAEGSNTTGWTRLQKLVGERGNEVIAKVLQWLGLSHPSSQAMKPQTSPVRKLLPFQPFPNSKLPYPLNEFVVQGAKALGCDPAFLALPALAAIASAIGNTRVIQLKKTWTEPSILWTAIVGDSGTLKSPALDLALKPLQQWQENLLAEFKEKQSLHQAQILAAKGVSKKDNPGSNHVEPVLQRVTVNDTTIEKLAETLEDNPRGVLLARDELASWFGSFSRYKAKGAPSDVSNWLELHRAGSFITDRKTGHRKHIHVNRGAVSVSGGIQPGTLARALSSELFDAGLPARLLMAFPPKHAKVWTEDEIAPDIDQDYQGMMEKLLALDFDTAKEQKQPHVLQLSPEGKEAWIRYYNDWGNEQSRVEGEQAATFSKLEGYTARLILLHHVVSHIAQGKDDLVPIKKESVDAGVALSKWFADESTRVYSMLTESTQENNARRLIEWIQGQGSTTTVKLLQHSNSRKYPNAEAATHALDALANGGHGHWANRPGDSRGGRPTRDFVLNPTDDDTDQTGSDEQDNGGSPLVKPPTPTNPSSNGVLGSPPASPIPSVSSDVGSKENVTRVSDTPIPPAGSGVSSDATSYTLINDNAGLEQVITSLISSVMVGLDLETTGLDPRSDSIRLLSLACSLPNTSTTTYLIDCFSVDPSILWPSLARKELVIHNAAFDLAFLARKGFTTNSKVHDTLLLAQLLNAGTGKKASLLDCCRIWLNLKVDKQEQKSDWSGALTASQLGYAAKDAEVLIRLQEVLYAKINEAGLTETARIEQNCLPAVLWVAQQGVPFNRDTWHKLAVDATDETALVQQELSQVAPVKPGQRPGGWNWNSPPQVKQALALAGCDVTDTTYETLSSIELPLAQLIRRYRSAKKRTSTYCPKWIDQHVSANGRVYASWKQVGTVTGRMSCVEPNMQQIPRGDFRRCVEAPPGRVLIKADYSQIELRIAAKISGDQALQEAYQRGEDLHIRTAQNVLGVVEVTAQHRQLAKALNFGLLFGMGAKGFRQYAKTNYSLNLTLEQAHHYRDAFFQTYPGLAIWHNKVRSMKAMQTRTLSGRRRLFDWKSPDTARLNTPVQGTGADGLKLALALLWERRHQVPDAFPVLAVHDEIVVECDADQATVVSAWLKAAMEEAMAELIKPVPVVVEIKTSRTWGGDLADGGTT